MAEPKQKVINPCVSCYYARMRKDICGIYCAGEYWKREDGSCKHYKTWKAGRKRNDGRRANKTATGTERNDPE